MIPLADLFNHSAQQPLNHHLVHRRLERENDDLKVKVDVATKTYHYKKSKVDLSDVFEGEINKSFKQPREYFDKPHYTLLPKFKYLSKHKKYLEDESDRCVSDSVQAIKSEINQKIRKINLKRIEEEQNKELWQLRYFTTTDSEDNDTDDELKEQKREQLEKMRRRELRQLYQTKQMIKKIVENKQQPAQQEDSDFSDDKSEENLTSDSQENSDSFTSEDQWDWYDSEDEEIYFVLNTERGYKKGEQIYNCYGNRTNRFLLAWYGFTYSGNKYDSVSLRFWMNPNSQRLDEQLFDKFIFRDFVDKVSRIQGFLTRSDNKILLSEVSKEFRLKRQHFDLDLLTYLRIFLMNHYNGADLAYVMATMPVSYQFELFVLKFAIHTMLYLVSKYRTTLHKDYILLDQKNSSLSPKLRYALIYRIAQKEIVDEQIEMLRNSLLVVETLKKDLTVKQAYQQLLRENKITLQQLQKIKNYLRLLSLSKKKNFFVSDRSREIVRLAQQNKN